MPKRILILLLLAALALAGCQQSAPVQTASPSKVVVTADTYAVTVAPTSTTTPTQAEVVPSEAPVAQEQAGCTAEGPRPTPGPTEEYLFPPVTEADWVLGKYDAQVTILEYSDFQ